MLKLFNSKEKTLKVFQMYCVLEMFQKIFYQVTWKKQDFIELFCEFSAEYGAISVDHILTLTGMGGGEGGRGGG